MSGELRTTLYYLFILSLVLIAVVYYVGVQTDAGALKDLGTSLLYASTGRNSGGQFQNYPK